MIYIVWETIGSKKCITAEFPADSLEQASQIAEGMCPRHLPAGIRVKVPADDEDFGGSAGCGISGYSEACGVWN
jgi:hypothetical protein